MFSTRATVRFRLVINDGTGNLQTCTTGAQRRPPYQCTATGESRGKTDHGNLHLRHDRDDDELHSGISTAFTQTAKKNLHNLQTGPSTTVSTRHWGVSVVFRTGKTIGTGLSTMTGMSTTSDERQLRHQQNLSSPTKACKRRDRNCNCRKPTVFGTSGPPPRKLLDHDEL